MTVNNSKTYGGNLLLKTGSILFLIGELIFLLAESKGDFANGILFFIDVQSNIFFGIFLLLYFSTFYFFGRIAGYLIIEKKRSYLTLAVAFAISSAILLTTYFGLYAIFYNNSVNPEYNKQHRSEIIKVFIKNFLLILTCMIFCWIWAAKRMSQKRLSTTHK